jgi:glycine cleavage system H protein
MFPDDLKYTEEHEWVRREGDLVIVGITNYAQKELQDIVFVELPEVGAEIKQAEVFGTVESVKVASPLYAPVSGEITEINEGLEDVPEFVNEDPYGSGWMIKIQMNGPNELADLLSADEYRALVERENEG